MRQIAPGCANSLKVTAATLCVVLGSKDVARAWPFKVATDAPGAGKRSAATGAAGAVCSLPDGNHGDNTSQVTE